MNPGQLTLICDAAYAFDYLAILMVKSVCVPLDTQNLLIQCVGHLQFQLGYEKYMEIFQSKEFGELLIANQHTFDLIEKLRQNQPVGTKQLDDANLVRFEKKKILQNKFFGGNLQETKTKI